METKSGADMRVSFVSLRLRGHALGVVVTVSV